MTLSRLGIAYTYENNMYNIPGRGGYVPDFYLPYTKAGMYGEAGCFLEIKPDIVPEGRESPTMELSSITRTPVITFYGFPFDIDIFFSNQQKENAYLIGESGGTYCDNFHMLGTCSICGGIEIQYMGKSERHSCDCKQGDKGSSYDSESLLLAYKYAANYRF